MRLAFAFLPHWLGCVADKHLPEPGVIIHNLHVVTRQELFLDGLSCLVLVPTLEVHEYTLELLAFVVGLVHHIHAFHLT